jgi:SWI/SNF-related matrix-associated actin-dependent regulator of chromatin subfamily B protein 1
MVASENGGSPIQMNLPEPTRPKEPPKKPVSRASLRLFKAPSVPPGAVRSRKGVAPIPSTGLDPSKYKRSALKEPVELPDDDTPSAATQHLPPTKLTAKQIRDMEKEAKEKEYAEGQHENMIDGVWHCSNCGCPESIAIGRRKGPLGDKSQCGPCGAYLIQSCVVAITKLTLLQANSITAIVDHDRLNIMLRSLIMRT